MGAGGRVAGIVSETSSSPASRTSRPGPVQNASTGTERWPFGPAMLAVAPSAIRIGIESPDGEELHRLPPSVARPWMPIPPMIDAASISPGYAFAIAGSP